MDCRVLIVGGISAIIAASILNFYLGDFYENIGYRYVDPSAQIYLDGFIIGVFIIGVILILAGILCLKFRS